MTSLNEQQRAEKALRFAMTYGSTPERLESLMQDAGLSDVDLDTMKARADAMKQSFLVPAKRSGARRSER